MCQRVTRNFLRMWLQRVSQHSNAQQQLELSSDTLPPHLLDSMLPPSRGCDSKPSSFLSAHRSAILPNDASPTALSSPSHRRGLPRILPLLSAALKHNCCDAAEAFQGLFAIVFTSARVALKTFCEVLERCFGFFFIPVHLQS
jgi:hypothetical protein